MKTFHELGLAILERWRQADFDAAAFPDLAAAALRERPPSETVEPIDVVRWVHEAPALVPQADIDIKFGQPPITVFSCEHFYIDVLFWVDGTTAIHQHRFAGAFHVMQGSSIHCEQRFTARRRYNEHLSIGTLDLLRVELLTKGDVHPIRPGREFVHSLFHLDRPSVSVVVRTRSDDFAGPQYSYSRAGLAFDPFTRSELTTRRIQTLELLREIDHPQFESLARASVRGADSFTAFQLLTHLVKGIDDPAKYAAFLDSILPAHSELVATMGAYAKERRREEFLMTRRRIVQQAEHRFFLALLLNVPRRDSILQLVERAFSGQTPTQTVTRWVRELTRLDAVHAWVAEETKVGGSPADRRILDVDVDEMAAELLDLLVEGVTEDEAVEALGKRVGTRKSGDDLRTICASLRNSVLRPLLAG